MFVPNNTGIFNVSHSYEAGEGLTVLPQCWHIKTKQERMIQPFCSKTLKPLKSQQFTIKTKRTDLLQPNQHLNNMLPIEQRPGQ